MDEWELDTPEQRKAGPSPAAPPAGSSASTPPGTAPATPEGLEPGSGELPGSTRPVTSTERSAHPAGGYPLWGGNRPRGRRPPPLWVAAALVILLVGVMIGFFVARAQTSGDAALLATTRDELGQLQRALALSEERNWAYYRANEALTAQLEEAVGGRPDTTASSVTGQSSGVFRDGVYLVGEDIAAGTYDGAVEGETGYWARLEATDGSTSAIIANAIVRGPFVLTIYVGDRAVELRGVTLTAR
jgi:hypothetical protein